MKFIALIAALTATEAKRLSPWTPAQYTNFRIRLVKSPNRCFYPDSKLEMRIHDCAYTNDELFYVNHETGAIHWAKDSSKIMGASGSRASYWEMVKLRDYDENRVDSEMWYDQQNQSFHAKGNLSMCLDNYYGNNSNGGQIGFWACYAGSPNQRFTMEPVTHKWDNNQAEA